MKAASYETGEIHGITIYVDCHNLEKVVEAIKASGAKTYSILVEDTPQLQEELDRMDCWISETWQEVDQEIMESLDWD